MDHLPTKAALSRNRQRLVEAMQALNFGRIEHLDIRGGEPTFSASTRIIQDIKLGSADNGPRPELGRHDFVLRSSVVELFGELDRLGNGVVSTIEVRYGLPSRMIVERPTGREWI